MLERVSDGRGRRGGVPLSQPHERQTGLRIPAGAMSSQKRFLGALDVCPAKPDPARARSAATPSRGADTGVAPRTRRAPLSPPPRTTRAAAGSPRGGPGSARGGSRWRSSCTSAPWPRSIPRPWRTARVPAARIRARSRRPQSREDRGHRRPSPPQPRRAARGPARHHRPRSTAALLPPVRARTPPGQASNPRRWRAGPTVERRAGRRSACAHTRERQQAKRSPASSG